MSDRRTGTTPIAIPASYRAPGSAGLSSRVLAQRAASLVASPLARQLIAFLAVGGVGFLVDLAVFNVLRATVLDPLTVPGGSFWAKAISTSVAIALNWIGNRTLAFRRSRETGVPAGVVAAEAARFLAASLLGASVSLLCLLVSRVVLGFHSALADNLSANVIGLGLGTALRFVLYRAWVFARRDG